MKWMKRISIWMVFSLVIQGLVLFYVDHYFLASNSKVNTKKVVEDKTAKSKNIDVKLPTDSKDMLVSYDAKYLSYFEDDLLKIVNCKNGDVTDIDAENGATISFSEWLPDRNRMLLVEKDSNDESSNLILYSYDVSKAEKVKVKELTWSSAESEVEDIQLSTLTGTTYVQVSNGGSSSSIYRIDRMGEITKISTIPKLVSNIALVRHEDKLVYEGSVYNKIYIAKSDNTISVNGVDKLNLLGTDDNDNVYVGEISDDLITRIYYGKSTDDTSQWKEFDLTSPTKKSDLFVSDDGKIYQNDKLKGILTEVNSGTQTSYEGDFIQLYTKGIVSKVNNKASFVPFK